MKPNSENSYRIQEQRQTIKQQPFSYCQESIKSLISLNSALNSPTRLTKNDYYSNQNPKTVEQASQTDETGNLLPRDLANLLPVYEMEQSGLKNHHFQRFETEEFERFRQETQRAYRLQAELISKYRYTHINFIIEKITEKLYQQQSQQHDTIHLSEKNATLANYFHQINQVLTSGDILALKRFWDNQMLTHLSSVINHWDIYSYQLLHKLVPFIRILEIKAYQSKEIYPIIYPEISNVITQVSKLLKLPTINETILQLARRQEALDVQRRTKEIYQQLAEHMGMKKEPLEDFLLKKFAECEKNEINNQKKEFTIQDKRNNIKTSLKKFIFQMTPQYQHQVKWKNAFDKTSASIRRSAPLQQLEEIMRRRKARLFQNIENVEVCPGCLGCATSFTEDFDIQSDSFAEAPIIAYPSILRAKQMKEQLLNSICALLNSGGGFIVFGCDWFYRKIVTEGQLITEQDKGELLNYLYSLIQLCRPKIEIAKEFRVSFVPVSKNPLMSNQNERMFIEGTYVTRIVIKPLFGQYTYFWIKDEDQNFTTLIEGKAKLLKSRNLIKTIKKKFHRHYFPESLSKFQRNLKWNHFRYSDHKCQSPDKGLIIANKKMLENRERSIISPENEFDRISLLICKKSQIPRIKQLLTALNIRFVIEVDRFKIHHFNSAKYTALMYHNLTQEEVFTKIAFNKDFDYNNKQLLVLAVTDYLKLENRTQANFISREQYHNISDWLNRQFPNERIRIWSFKTKQQKTQIYISTQSKLSRTFLYYFLNDFNQKVTFKNPPNLQKMSQEQVQTCFKQLAQYYTQNQRESA